VVAPDLIVDLIGVLEAVLGASLRSVPIAYRGGGTDIEEGGDGNGWRDPIAAGVERDCSARIPDKYFYLFVYSLAVPAGDAAKQ
jgi:hypothetical protein